MGRKKDHNKPSHIFGGNQHRAKSLISDYPNLREILQGYADNNIQLSQMPAQFYEDFGEKPSRKTLSTYMKKLCVLTVRRSGLTDSQKTGAIIMVSQDDPLERWGAILVQKKLAKKGIHISRDFIVAIRRARNPEGTAARNPFTRKSRVHKHGIWSIGPNEEWCVDGHEKLANSMGISVWGIIDKFSRMELGLWAMPNARVRDIPPVLFLHAVKKWGGMPTTVTSDKGGEVGTLISLVTTMRKQFQPFLSEERIPAFKAVKSVFNITRERGWRPIWEKELGNVLLFYNDGKVAAGFLSSNVVHRAVSYWLWGRIVQELLVRIMDENQTHRIRRQKGILLPSGARRIDLYTRSPEFGPQIKDRIIRVDQSVVDDLLSTYDRPEQLMFGSPEDVAICEDIYKRIGAPPLSPRLGWGVFVQMISYYDTLE